MLDSECFIGEHELHKRNTKLLLLIYFDPKGTILHEAFDRKLCPIYYTEYSVLLNTTLFKYSRYKLVFNI